MVVSRQWGSATIEAFLLIPFDFAQDKSFSFFGGGLFRETTHRKRDEIERDWLFVNDSVLSVILFVRDWKGIFFLVINPP